MSDSDEEEFLLLLALSHKKRTWVHDVNKRRKLYGEYNHLCRELESDEDRFFSYFRMTRNSVDCLHGLLCEEIEKQDTNYRQAITSRERLAICLRYLSTGDSYKTIAFSFRVGCSTVSKIIKEVCEAIWDKLQPIYMPSPTEEKWKESEAGYRELWGFPNCVGSIDGKHVKIQCPSNSGSNYYCYKSYFSIVLLAIADPFYKFLVVDIGSYGRHSDSGIFENSVFFQQYIAGKEILPPKPLPGSIEPVPHVLIGDEGFGLKPYLMRPYPKEVSAHNTSKRNYNHRLCRARRIIENVFGILTQKWRVFNKPMECGVETAIHVVKAACCLHNFVRVRDGLINPPIQQSINTSSPETSHSSAFSSFRYYDQRGNNDAFRIREKFVAYFDNN